MPLAMSAPLASSSAGYSPVECDSELSEESWDEIVDSQVTPRLRANDYQPKIVKLSLAMVLFVLPAILVGFVAQENHRHCGAAGLSCTLSPRLLWVRANDMYTQCHPGTVPCAGSCLVGSPNGLCCVGPLGDGILCLADTVCCDGVCLANGTGCSETCAPGMVSCGGECLLGTPEDSCCIGPTGNGMVCAPDAECCGGICLGQGHGCAVECAPGLMRCGVSCLAAGSGSKCCEDGQGIGVVCEESSQCCDGGCVIDGTGCSESCAPGLIRCGGHCLAGSPEDTCCVGPSGLGIVCGPTAECCNGICLAEGAGCADQCGAGLVHCGGQCLEGDKQDKCCEGSQGREIVCPASAECCDGACVLDGTGCAEVCEQGLVACGGECLVGNHGEKCCPGPAGKSTICEPSAECCAGVCVDGGCASPCPEGLLDCGGRCLEGHPGSTCCGESSGGGVLCLPGHFCCNGVCEVTQCSLAGYLA